MLCSHPVARLDSCFQVMSKCCKKLNCHTVAYSASASSATANLFVLQPPLCCWCVQAIFPAVSAKVQPATDLHKNFEPNHCAKCHLATPLCSSWPLLLPYCSLF